MQSGNDVRRQFVFDPGNFILQRKLLFFQPPQLQRIGPPAFFQRVNGIVQIPMFGAEHFQFDAQHVFGWHFLGVAHFIHIVLLGNSTRSLAPCARESQEKAPLARGGCCPHMSNVVAGIGAAKTCRLNKDVSMTKMNLGTHPFLLGFEQLERMVEQAAKTGKDGYPPFNIEQVSDRAYRITLAVAGFADDDLAITVENAKLVIRGAQSDSAQERVFLHRGIAARQFVKSFVLADGVDVIGAKTENGLLHIDLERAEPERLVQTIQINKG